MLYHPNQSALVGPLIVKWVECKEEEEEWGVIKDGIGSCLTWLPEVLIYRSHWFGGLTFVSPTCSAKEKARRRRSWRVQHCQVWLQMPIPICRSGVIDAPNPSLQFPWESRVEGRTLGELGWPLASSPYHTSSKIYSSGWSLTNDLQTYTDKPESLLAVFFFFIQYQVT